MLEVALAFIVIAVAMFLGAAWGAGENRLWKEAGETVILNNFRLYHLCMALLFGSFNVIAVIAINLLLGLPYFGWKPFVEWLFLMVWDTLILDVVWWTIRCMDITHLGQVLLFVKIFGWEWAVLYPEVNEYDLDKGKPWHSQADWDNWLHPPLIAGCYWWWWWTFVLVLAGSGAYILLF
jgi:hypothetical protein